MQLSIVSQTKWIFIMKTHFAIRDKCRKYSFVAKNVQATRGKVRNCIKCCTKFESKTTNYTETTTILLYTMYNSGFSCK